MEAAALSPNQLAKRQQIVAAAQEVLLQRGPAGCTTREIARVSGLNKGLIYYYFESIEEIIDAAMSAFAEEAAAAMTEAPTAAGHPDAQYTALLSSYLSIFSVREGLPLAWLEYWTLCIREGRSERLVWLADQVIDLITDALRDTDGDDAPVRARIVVSYIMGVIVRGLAEPTVLNELGPELASLSRTGQIPTP